MQEYREARRPIAVHALQLRRETVSCCLKSKPNVQIRYTERQVPFITDRERLNSPYCILLNLKGRRFFADEQRSIAVDVLDSGPYPVSRSKIYSGLQSIGIED